jgi:rod shape-determining protein MreD
MRWTAFTIALVSVYLAQVGILWRFGVGWLDLFLAYALLVALIAPTAEARLAGWIVGLAQDLGSTGPIGIHALSLGLAAFLLTRVRELLNVQVWWPRGLALWLAGLPAAALAVVHRNAWSATGEWNIFSAIGSGVTTSLAAALLVLLLTTLPALTLRRRQKFSRIRA